MRRNRLNTFQKKTRHRLRTKRKRNRRHRGGATVTSQNYPPGTPVENFEKELNKKGVAEKEEEEERLTKGITWRLGNTIRRFSPLSRVNHKEEEKMRNFRKKRARTNKKEAKKKAEKAKRARRDTLSRKKEEKRTKKKEKKKSRRTMKERFKGWLDTPWGWKPSLNNQGEITKYPVDLMNPPALPPRTQEQEQPRRDETIMWKPTRQPRRRLRLPQPKVPQRNSLTNAVVANATEKELMEQKKQMDKQQHTSPIATAENLSLLEDQLYQLKTGYPSPFDTVHPATEPVTPRRSQ